MVQYRILSLDGGGIRGLITSILLERLEAAVPGFLSQIDLYAGTSTGGLLALALASGITPEEAKGIYAQRGGEVFQSTYINKLLAIGNLIGAAYPLEPLKKALKNQFGEMNLDQLDRKVLISSFDLDNSPPMERSFRTWKAKFFHNFPGSDSDGDQKVVDVALRTSNAPTYFPIYQGFIDGGVVANNPSMCALAQALHPSTGGQKLEEIALLSAGTGHNPRYLTLQIGNWGVLHWAPHMLNLMLEGNAGLADYQCKQLLGSNYLRINPKLPCSIPMDNVEEIPRMIEIANQFDIEEAINWVNKYYLA